MSAGFLFPTKTDAALMPKDFFRSTGGTEITSRAKAANVGALGFVPPSLCRPVLMCIDGRSAATVR